MLFHYFDRFLADYAVVDRIINHLKLTFVGAKPHFSSDRFAGALDGR
ncbi:MAG: hypothetical protein QHH14_12875 [Clostridiales bacterium]|nr:hypothetical protein [Clostridiales bacterium]